MLKLFLVSMTISMCLPCCTMAQPIVGESDLIPKAPLNYMQSLMTQEARSGHCDMYTTVSSGDSFTGTFQRTIHMIRGLSHLDWTGFTWIHGPTSMTRYPVHRVICSLSISGPVIQSHARGALWTSRRIGSGTSHYHHLR